MKRVRMIVAYDGTNYRGWQIQPNGITIEEVLNKKLTELLKEPIAIIGASRTDSGVHAEGNVAVFDTENRMAADKICYALNQRLPDDIRIMKSEEVSLDCHPRRQNCVKTYEYRILNRKISVPTLRLYSHFCYIPLDVEKMKEGARYLLGEHDFKSFCTPRPHAEQTVRIIYSLDVDKQGDMILIRISGSGFLYNMVRIIAGTLMKVGMGAYPPEHMEEILDALDRTAAGPKIEAQGLTLVSLEYETQVRPLITGENKYWSYQLHQTDIVPKKKAYLIIERCVNEYFDRVITRVVHQAVRNGAEEVYICDCDPTCRIVEGKEYGYYSPRHCYDFVRMKCAISSPKLPKTQEALALKPVTESEIDQFKQLYNDIFFDVAGAGTLTRENVLEDCRNICHQVRLITQNGQAIGVAKMTEREGHIMELDALGLKKELQNKGLGDSVLRVIENSVLAEGFETISLLVCSENSQACHLFKKYGFQEESLVSRWFLAKKTLILWEKEVDTPG